MNKHMETALRIVDVQRGLFESTPPPHEAEAVLERINLLSSKARDAQPYAQAGLRKSAQPLSTLE